MAARKSKEVATLQQQIAEQAAKMNQSIGSATGNRLRVTQGKKFVDPDGNETSGPINVVILDFNTQHMYFPGVFDRDNPVPPDCFALSEPASLGGSIESLTPSSSAPEKQSTACKGCPMNEFGTDARARGKACKNTRVLAVVSPDADPEDVPILLLSVSPSGLKRFDAYVRSLASRQLIPMSALTQVSFDESVDYPSLMFDVLSENQALGAHYARLAEAQALLRQEPDLTQAAASEDASKKRPTKKRAAKKTSRRRVA